MVLRNFKQLNLVKETFIYTATDAFGRAIGFLLLPFVSYFMPPNELGIATNYSVLSSIITLLAGQAVVNALPYFYYEQTKEENRQLISNLLMICFATCVLLFFCIIGFNSLIYKYLKLDTCFQLLTIVSVVAGLTNSTGYILLRLENKPYNFASIQLIQIVLHCLAVIVLVILLKWGALGKILSEVIVAVILSAIHTTLMFRKGYITFVIDKSMIIKLLKFGVPLLPHSLSFWFKGGMDKVFITSYCGLYQNGLYSMAMTISSLYSVVSNAFFSAYTPYLQKSLSNMTTENEEHEKRGIVLLIYKLFCAFFLLALGAIIGGWIIVYYIIDEKYEESFKFIPWIILALYIKALYSFTIQFIYKKKKTFVLGIITFISSIIQMLLSYVLIKNLGIMGAVYSGCVAALITSVAIAIYSYIVYPMPWFSFVKNRN